MTRNNQAGRSRKSAVTEPDLIAEVPPHDIDAEQAVLGAVLNGTYSEQAPETLDTVAGIVKGDDFYSDANRRIFQGLLALRDSDEPVEALALRSYLEKVGELEAVGGEAYLAEIVIRITPPTNAAHYARVVSGKAKLRRTRAAAAMLLAECQSPDADIAKIRKQLDQARDGLDGREAFSMIGASQWVLEFDLDEKKAPPIPTGFPTLDAMLSGGLRRQNQMVVGARPRVGKTATAGNLIRNICFNQKIPTIFFSLEMSREEILKRMVADMADVYHGKIQQPDQLCQYDRRKIVEALNDIGECPFFIDDRCGITLSEMLSAIRLGVRKNGVQVVFVDQASLVNAELPSPTASKRDEITAVTVALKRIARELNIVVVLLAQVNRAGAQGPNGTNLDERKIRALRPALEHLKESGSLEENADIVLFIHRAEILIPEEEAEKYGLIGKAEWIVAKQRSGKEGVIPMQFEGGFMRFTEDVSPETSPEEPPTDHKNYQPQFGAFDARSAAAGEKEDQEVFDGF